MESMYEVEGGHARVSGGYVSNVFIRPALRGQGRGNNLMQSITSDADKEGVSLALHTRDELVPWYKKHGFDADKPDMFGIKMQRSPRGT